MRIKYNILLISLLCLLANKAYAQSNKYLLAKIDTENNNYAKAYGLVESYSMEYPNYKPALFLKAKLMLELKQYNKALLQIQELKNNYDADILLMKARANAALGKNTEAIALLDKYLQSTKKMPEPIICAYKEFDLLKSTDEWNKIWQTERYTKKEQLMNNILFAIKTKKNLEAHDRLNEFLDKYKTNAQAHYLKALLLFEDKQYDKALKHVENSVDKNKKVIEYKLLKAKCLTALRKSKKALGLYNEIIRNDSLYLSAYLGRAQAYLVNKQAENAEDDILKYRAYYPNDKYAQQLNADIDAANGDYLGAISNYGKLIKSNPAKAEYFVGRANAYMQTKTYKYAIRDYSMALDLDPKNVNVYKQKAQAHKLAGEKNKACSEWKHAAKLGDIDSMNNLARYCK